MKVFKFGGASVKDAAAVHNVSQIVRQFPGPLLIIVSAMGKTTNALEEVYNQALTSQNYIPGLLASQQYHAQIIKDLFPDSNHPIFGKVTKYFQFLHTYLSQLETGRYDEQYDQVVSVGELISSEIIASYLSYQNLPCLWHDCRQSIFTDTSWREAKVNWPETEKLVNEQVAPLLQDHLVVTQGFLGGTTLDRTTTLGREGSDFSGSIFAYCLKADSLTIWKDVDGFLNADPKYFTDTVKYTSISYHDTVEMAYYGASVIHPKTIKPLATRNIPLYVKSFLHPDAPGTLICDSSEDKLNPAFIHKANQCLISFSVRDYSFISEKNLSVIFHTLAELRFKINVMQNSAISFSVCTDYDEERLQSLLEQLQEQFSIHYNNQLLLFTIKNYDEESITFLTRNKNILLEQRTRTTYQFVSREE